MRSNVCCDGWAYKRCKSEQSSWHLFPCIPTGRSVDATCPVKDTSYGLGTAHVKAWLIPINANTDFESRVCLENSVSHDKVDFKMSADEAKYHLMWGTISYQNSETRNTSVNGFACGCRVIANSIFSHAASKSADLDSTLSLRIAVTDSHGHQNIILKNKITKIRCSKTLQTRTKY